MVSYYIWNHSDFPLVKLGVYQMKNEQDLKEEHLIKMIAIGRKALIMTFVLLVIMFFHVLIDLFYHT